MTRTITTTTEYHFPREKRCRNVHARDPYDGLRFWSAATHGLGAVLSLIGGAALLAMSAAKGLNAVTIIALAIFLGSMVMMYLSSCLYHCVNTTVRGRVFLRKLDHAMIYVLIAGTYTPICLGVLGGKLGWGLCGLIWSMAILGVGVTLLWLNAPRILTTMFYVGMGWMAVLALEPLLVALNSTATFWMFAGGITYTAGGILYALKWPCRNGARFGCHEIFHLFVLGGSACFFAMMCVVFL